MDQLFGNFNAAWYALGILLPPMTFGVVLVIGLSAVFKKYLGVLYMQSTTILAVCWSFGMTIGLFMGASKSDIVSSLLPPIITLVSGYIVYLGSKELSSDIKRLIPGGVFVFLMCLVFSAYYMKAWYQVVTS